VFLAYCVGGRVCEEMITHSKKSYLVFVSVCVYVRVQLRVRFRNLINEGAKVPVRLSCHKDKGSNLLHLETKVLLFH